ncbi:hypothetical protein [Labedella endophytica]|uniref:Uncharacterized protein n=1 Tax=Labedella endophytica TaxID=1523160 RepID=A0A433JPH1_9MICO|nr:hypothetical protein [Labedella endophytica]RUQ98297.1 hypothetical protein ELQ94_14935 [Labedella endophytica]
MKTIHYNQSRFETADAIARAVLVYAEALATRQRFAVVDIPTVTRTGVEIAHLLIGPGIPIAYTPALDDPVLGDIPRDEFAGDAAAAVPIGLGELDVRRAVRALTEGTMRVRVRIAATPLDGETLLEEPTDLGAV